MGLWTHAHAARRQAIREATPHCAQGRAAAGEHGEDGDGGVGSDVVTLVTRRAWAR